MGCCKDNQNNAQADEKSCCKKEGQKGSCGCKSSCGGKCYCRCLLGFLFGWMCCKKKENCCKSGSDEKMMNSQCCKMKGEKKHGTRNDVVNAGKIMLGLVEKQIAGTTAEQLVSQPGGVKNHPLWSLGHIAVTLNGIVTWLGGQSMIDNEKWQKLFGGGTQPTTNANDYPSPAELMKTVNELYAKASEMYLSASSEVLRSPNPRAQMMPMCPTLGSFIVFLLGAHMAEHIGQISAWRRAMGKDPLF